MPSPSPDHRSKLERYARVLSDQSFPSRLQPAGNGVPCDVLLVSLADQEDNAPGWQLELSFLPGMEEQLEGASLIQFFVGLPVTVAESAVAELQRAVTTLNRTLPLIGFGHLSEPPMACFRHVLMLPDDDDTAAALVIQSTWMVSYLLALFGAPVAAVASGRTTLREALRGHPHAYLVLPEEQ